MAKFCPLTKENVVYLQCQECETKVCRKDHRPIENTDDKKLKERSGADRRSNFS